MDEHLPVARQVVRAGAWREGEAVGTVRLDHQGRQQRRRRLVTEDGRAFLLDLAANMHLADGDALLLEDGALVRVAAQMESLLDIHAQDATSLMRIVWHLGNRHLPVEISGEHLRTATDHVVAQMVERLGGRVEAVRAVFTPEAGAYATGGHAHNHAADGHRQDGHHAHEQPPHGHG